MFKLQPFKIINSKTRKRFLLNEINHTDLSEKELAELILLLKTCSKELKEKITDLEIVFNEKMKEKRAHKYQDLEMTAEIKENVKYEYNFDIIEELIPLITEEQFKSAFTKTYVVNRKALKGLMALGGIVRDIIDKATIRKEGKPTIKVEKIS